MVPTCRDRCRPVPTCRYGGWGVRPHDFQGKATYNGTTDAGQTPPQHDGAPACPRAGSTAPVPTRWQAPSRPPHGMLACSVLGHTDDDGQDVVCETGQRQTAVDDTPVATGRPRVVNASGGGREHHDRRRRERLRRRGRCAAARVAHAPPAVGRAPGCGVHVGLVTWLTIDQGCSKARLRPTLVPGWKPAHRGTHGLATDERSGWQGPGGVNTRFGVNVLHGGET
jgi:hypothetical protein